MDDHCVYATSKVASNPFLSSRWIRRKRHLLIILALALDLLVLALAWTVQQHDIFLDTNDHVKMLQKFLPVIGALTGLCVTSVNVLAFTALITEYAKIKMVDNGLTLQDLGHLHSLANTKLVFTWTPLFALACLLLVGEGLIPTVCVSSMTPSDFSWVTTGSTPVVDFSASSGIIPEIECEYATAMTNNPNAYSYGTNCPIDYAYGDIYNAGLQSFRGTFPTNTTRQGVSYPSSLLGLSGAFTSAMSTHVSSITNNQNRNISSDDTFDTCLPRVVAEVNCSRELEDLQWFNVTYVAPPGGVPQGVVGASLCDNSTTPISCQDPQYGIQFSTGTIVATWQMDPNSGNSTLSMYNFAAYADAMTSSQIQCKTAAYQTLEPIRITGGVSVEPNPDTDFKCTNSGEAQPTQLFILNITRIADMAFIKMQGKDGILEPISYVPNGTDRVFALQEALRTMVSVGATEMYAFQTSNSTVLSSYDTPASQQPYTYTTTRTRLGSKSGHILAFASSTVILTGTLLSGYIYISALHSPALHSSAVHVQGMTKNHTARDLPFNPLHPASIALAGLNRNERETLPRQVEEHHVADPDGLHDVPIVLRYGFVNEKRLGLHISIDPLEEPTNGASEASTMLRSRNDSFPISEESGGSSLGGRYEQAGEYGKTEHLKYWPGKLESGMEEVKEFDPRVLYDDPLPLKPSLILVRLVLGGSAHLTPLKELQVRTDPGHRRHSSSTGRVQEILASLRRRAEAVF
ncbi:uncharacterized protein STEHIDRAFT_112641 [Stereum hirsutum FP-91666 SS1]|uniref:uncharacterized protein n=1 Tax=Stereum hirsutum (strain FP-91666) TaxID=721885 RepID=UPI0004449700|nr:uncharacterized protein STEHIDRAFT_112641 [Stereum hirsutum FP-91666 SS1]EIM84198.1 hypothetical protein STEHIDRAFT_112641 [Stereum hirsutum FP-91666 SS1]